MTVALRAKPYDRIKDPQSKLDFGFNWVKWLDAVALEVIITSAWVADSGITIESSPDPTTISGDNTTAVWLSGGTVGSSYLVTNTITTDVGRIDERSYRIHIVNR